MRTCQKKWAKCRLSDIAYLERGITRRSDEIPDQRRKTKIPRITDRTIDQQNSYLGRPHRNRIQLFKQHKSRRTRNRSSGFFYFKKPLRHDCNQLRFDCPQTAFVRRTLFTSGANHDSGLQCIVTVQNNLFHNTIVPKIKGKNYYIETKKNCRERNKLPLRPLN